MGVYIKGMKMPQGCFFCICNKHLDPDTDMCILTRDAFDSTFRVVEHRRDNCPLVPVPPHGRLIDADAVIDLVMQYCPDDDGACSKAGADLRELLDEIENLPTIIPAEEGE